MIIAIALLIASNIASWILLIIVCNWCQLTDGYMECVEESFKANEELLKQHTQNIKELDEMYSVNNRRLNELTMKVIRLNNKYVTKKGKSKDPKVEIVYTDTDSIRDMF